MGSIRKSRQHKCHAVELSHCKGEGMPSGNGHRAHEYSGHLYPQPAPGLAPDSSILQIGTVASKLSAILIFASSPRNYSVSISQGHPARTQGNTFFCGQRAWGWALEALGLRPRCLTKALCTLGQDLRCPHSPAPHCPREIRRNYMSTYCVPATRLWQFCGSERIGPHFTDEKN